MGEGSRNAFVTMYDPVPNANTVNPHGMRNTDYFNLLEVPFAP